MYTQKNPGSKTNIILILAYLLLFSSGAFSQVGIGTLMPDASAKVDISGTDGGLLIPRMDSIQRKNISSPAEGLLVYDLSTSSFWYFQNGGWGDLSKAGRVFEIIGDTLVRNTGNHAIENFVFGSPQINYDGNLSHNARMFFDKRKRAFRAGSPRDTNFLNGFVGGDSLSWDRDSLGYFSSALGFRNEATGIGSSALGYQTKAHGNIGTTALGDKTKATGDRGATAIGRSTVASGNNGATALGYSTIANGNNGATALGQFTQASGNDGATALGTGTVASGWVGATALGENTETSGTNGATALGTGTVASGSSGATALGESTLASGWFGATALGHFTEASGFGGATALGSFTKASANTSIAIGGGHNVASPMENNISNTLMVGFESDIATFFVGPANGLGTLGKVGIGTTNPQSILHLSGGDFIIDRGSSINNLTRELTIGGARNSAGNDFARINFDNYDDISDAMDRTRAKISSTNANAAGNGDLRFYTYDATLTERVRIEGGGNVGIGNINPSELLDVNGNARFRIIGSTGSANDIHVDGNGVLTTNTSDRRLKENIYTLEDALEKITKLRGVSFSWKNNPGLGVRHGLIAQEVREVAPEITFQGEEGYYGVNTSQLVGLFVEAFKEQQGIILQLQSDLNNLEKEVKQLKALGDSPSFSNQ